MESTFALFLLVACFSLFCAVSLNHLSKVVLSYPLCYPLCRVRAPVTSSGQHLLPSPPTQVALSLDPPWVLQNPRSHFRHFRGLLPWLWAEASGKCTPSPGLPCPSLSPAPSVCVCEAPHRVTAQLQEERMGGSRPAPSRNPPSVLTAVQTAFPERATPCLGEICAPKDPLIANCSKGILPTTSGSPEATADSRAAPGCWHPPLPTTPKCTHTPKCGPTLRRKYSHVETQVPAQTATHRETCVHTESVQRLR